MSLQNVTDEETQPITPEEYLLQRKATLRKRSLWAIGIGVVVTAFHLVVFALADVDPLLLFRSIFFILGLLAIVGGAWGIYESRRITLQDLIPTPEAIEFAQAAAEVKPYYTFIIIGCIVAVTFAQFATGLDQSVELAGLKKQEVLQAHQYWRILTAATLHGGLLHIYFNSQAAYGLGALIEFLSNRAHLVIVFLLSVITGGIFSIVFMPNVDSIGASGGIVGFIGYLAVFGYRRKQQLPPDFLKRVMINIAFIALLGALAYQMIDNAAHLGGLLAGAAYGFVQIPRSLDKDPREISSFAEALGLVSLTIFVATAILTIALLMNWIHL
jgi:rhomboid protease GluP